MTNSECRCGHGEEKKMKNSGVAENQRRVKYDDAALNLDGQNKTS